MPRWSTQRGGKPNDIKNVEHIGFGDLNVDDRGEKVIHWIVYTQYKLGLYCDG